MKRKYSFKERDYVRCKILKLVNLVSNFTFSKNNGNLQSFVKERFIQRIENLKLELDELSNLETSKIFNSDLKRINKVFKTLDSYPSVIKVPESKPLFNK